MGQEKPADNMQILREKIKADKKLLAETNLKSSYAAKLSKVLPARKVARYLQIENKIRAVIKDDLAATVPLV